MKLNTVQPQGQWSEISDCINENFQKIDMAVQTLEKSTTKLCGYFKTVSELRSAYPSASLGAKAYVGVSAPYAIYEWDATSATWVDSGYTGGEETIHVENITEINGDIVNTPDNEDLIEENDVLKFADKAYSVSSYSGLGRTFLRKNIVSNINVLTRDMFLDSEGDEKQNTIYHIQYDYDLRGATVTIPEGCVLQFEGGSISNGTLVGNATSIKAGQQRIFGNNIVISGEWKCQDIYDSWFAMSEAVGANNRNNLQNLCNLTSDDYKGVIHLSNKVYYASTSSNSDSEALMSINSNTEVCFDCTLRLNRNGYGHYRLVNINNKENIYIHGLGIVEGDVEGKSASDEHGHGLAIIDSQNIVVEGITFAKCWGDGIYIGQNEAKVSLYSQDITIKNVVCDGNRRQGMSVTTAKNLLVENSLFINTGSIKATPPAFGVDIEPNLLGVKLENIHFKNCEFRNNQKGGLLALNCDSSTSIFAEGCVSDGNFKLASNAKNITYIGCTFPDLEVALTPSASDNIKFVNCHIDTNEGLFMPKYSAYSFKNCSFREINGVSQRVYRLSTTADNPVCKVTVPSDNLADGFYKVTAMGGFNVRNIHYISEFYIRVRNIGSTKNVGKSGVRIIANSNGGLIDIEDYTNNGFVMNNPTFDGSGNLVFYISNVNNVRFDIVLSVELNAMTGINGLVGVNCEAVAISAMPNTDYTFVPLNMVKGSTSKINTYLTKQAGVCVFNTSANKPVWWNGSAWVDAMGTSV